jgi:hypothetical protein
MAPNRKNCSFPSPHEWGIFVRVFAAFREGRQQYA